MKQRDVPEKSFSTDKEKMLSRIVPALVFSVSFAVTYQLSEHENAELEWNVLKEFSLRNNEIYKKITDQMRDYGQVLYWVRALFTNWLDCREEFRNFVTALDIERNYPWIIWITLDALVSSDNAISHVNKLRREWLVNYAIFPPGIREYYAPITYIEPSTKQNVYALGYDPLVNPIRRAIMEEARDLNRAMMTPKIQLIQDIGTAPQAAFIVNLPVYRNGLPNASPGERKANISGWLGLAIKMDKFMEIIIKNDLFEWMDVEIYDGIKPSKDTLIFNTNHSWIESADNDEKKYLFNSSESIEIFWHYWTIVTHSLPYFEWKLDNGRGPVIMASWLGISFFLAIFFFILINGKKRAIKVAQDMNIELIESKDRLQTIIEANMDAVILLDDKGAIIDWGGQSEKIFGFTQEEALGKNLSDLLISEDHKNAHINYIDHLTNIYPSSFSVFGKIRESSAKRKDNTEFPIELSFSRIPWKDGYEFCGFIRDITERKSASMKILEMATHDALTGLPNRNLLSDRLQQAIHVSERSWDYCAVLFLDLDRFKQVNDIFWHEIGDILLKEVSARLTSVLRSEDTIARFWWDEFVMIAPELKSKSDIDIIAEKIKQILTMPFYIKEQEIFIGVSIGISIFPDDAVSISELLKKSDMRMYEAKHLEKMKCY